MDFEEQIRFLHLTFEKTHIKQQNILLERFNFLTKKKKKRILHTSIWEWE